jgi:hypothetical protein
MFNNLLQMDPEMIKQIDFSSQDQLGNLASRSIIAKGEAFGRSSLDMLQDSPDQQNSWQNIVGKAVPGIVKGFLGYLNPVAGAAMGALQGKAQDQDWGDIGKSAALSLGASAVGGAVSGGFGAAQAGTGIGEGAMGGVMDTMTSANLAGAGRTLLGGEAAQPSIEELGGPFASPEAALEGGKGGQFALEDVMTGAGTPGVTDASANLAAQFAGAPTGKDALKSVAGDAISAFSSIFSPENMNKGKGSGLYAEGTGLAPGYMGALDESGMGLLNPYSEQQIGGIGAR